MGNVKVKGKWTGCRCSWLGAPGEQVHHDIQCGRSFCTRVLLLIVVLLNPDELSNYESAPQQPTQAMSWPARIQQLESNYTCTNR